jgi:Kef-type K+ transport system membrane component KefB
MVALIFSTTSLGIVVPVLKERGMTATRYGQTLLVSSVVANFGSRLLITAAAATISREMRTAEICVVYRWSARGCIAKTIHPSIVCRSLRPT